MAGYTRQSLSDIQTGLVVEAEPINREYDSLQNAFSNSLGHKHDGSPGEGAPITVTGPTLNVYTNNTSMYPRLTNTVSLGTSSLKFKDIYFSGGITGNGANLTNLTGANVTGTIPVGVLPSTVVLSDISILNGSGITGGGNLSTSRTLSVDSTVVRTTGSQTIGGSKTFSSPLMVTNTFNVDGSGPSSQQDGLYVADLGTVVGTTNNPVNTSAIVGQISDNRSVAVSVDQDGYLYGYRGHTTAGPFTFNSKVRYADKWTTPRTLTFTGDVSGSVVVDGSSSPSIAITVIDDSHDHVISNVDGLQSALDAKASLSGATFTGNVLLPAGSVSSPSLATTTDTNTGLQWLGSGKLAISTGGVRAALFDVDANLSLYNTAGTYYTKITNQPTANRTLTIPDGDVALVPGTMVPTYRSVIAGLGLKGGGDLSGSRTISFDPGSLPIVGTLTTPRVVVVDQSVADSAARMDATAFKSTFGIMGTSWAITAGNGLSGGGDGTASRTLTVGAGDGITVGTNTVSVNSTVVRTSGDQTIGGTKTFSSNAYFSTNIVLTGATSTSNPGVWLKNSSDRNLCLLHSDYNSSKTYLRSYDTDGTSYKYFVFDGSNGVLTADKFSGNGSLLTALNGSNISSGNIAKERIASAMNASGSAPLYACRAMASVTAAGVLANGKNVASVVKNGTGSYTIKFSTALPSYYVPIVNVTDEAGSSSISAGVGNISNTSFDVYIRYSTSGSNGWVDANFRLAAFG